MADIIEKRFPRIVTTDSQDNSKLSGGGSSETREPMFSFDVTAETSYTLSKDETRQFIPTSMTSDLYVGNTKFYYDSAEQDGNLLTIHYYPADEDYELLFSANLTNYHVSVTSSISGTLSAYENFAAPIVIQASYSNDTITTYDPAILILYNVLRNDGAVAVLHVEGTNTKASGYLTVSEYFVDSVQTINISCDIDIYGKFAYSIDNGYIKGTHGAA